MRLRFRRWRRSRPFWAGLWTLFSGGEILAVPLLPVSDFVSAAIHGASSVLVGAVIFAMGALMWFSPRNQTLAGIITLIFSVASLVLSNLGGLGIGMFAGIVGGALAVAWTDKPRKRRGRKAPATEPGRSAEQPAEQWPVEDTDTRQIVRLRTLPRIALLAVVALLATPQFAAAAPAAPAPTVRCVPVPTTDQLTQLLTPLTAEQRTRLLTQLSALVPDLATVLPSLGQLLTGLTAPLLGLLTGTPSPAPPTCPAGQLPWPVLPGLPVPQLPDPQLPDLRISVPTGTETAPGLPLPTLPGLPVQQAPTPQPTAQQPTAQQQTAQQQTRDQLLANRAATSPQALAVPGGFVAARFRSLLTMKTLDVTGLVYQGVVTLPTAGGSVQVMRYTMTDIDADGLELKLPVPNDYLIDLTHTAGRHVLGKTVVLDCTRLRLNVLGIPLDFDINGLRPPPGFTLPLRVPTTDVNIDLVTLQIGQLAVPTAKPALVPANPSAP